MNVKLFTILICLVMSFPVFGRGGQRSHSQDNSPPAAVVGSMFTPEVLNRAREYADNIIGNCHESNWIATAIGLSLFCQEKDPVINREIVLRWDGSMIISKIKYNKLKANEVLANEKSDWRRFR